DDGDRDRGLHDPPPTRAAPGGHRGDGRLRRLLLFNAGYYQWWGGSAMGPRLMIPMFAIVPLILAAACREDAPAWMWRPLAVTLGLAVVLTLPVSMVNAQFGGGNTTEHLTDAGFGTRIATPQLDAWRNFFMLRWDTLKPEIGLPNWLSFLLCLMVVVVGTTLAYRAASRGDPDPPESLDPDEVDDALVTA
ncbi:MAG: hypothetical protein ABMA25_05165, partial [Ilumatobacteraceae bacterium]